MIIRNILLTILFSLAATQVASADIVVFGRDTVVTDTIVPAATDFDEILRSMSAGNNADSPDALSTSKTSATSDAEVGSLLDYMSNLFDTGTFTGGSSVIFKKAAIPEGDIPINVSELCIPVHGPITSHFGPRKKSGHIHRGIDIGLHRGDTIRAAFPGSVATTGYDKRGYGYYVILSHPNGLQTLYAHLDHFLVIPTTTVDAGTPIAIGGSSGNSTGPHLHFETRYCATPIDPAAIIDFRRRRPHDSTFIFNKDKI